MDELAEWTRWADKVVAFWGLVIWAVVALAQGLSRPSGSNSASGQQDSALEILKRRYAKRESCKEKE